MKNEVIFSFGGDLADYSHKLTEYPTPDSVSFQLHSHNRHEIFYMLQGDADFSIEGTRYHLQKGMLLLSASGQVHHLTINNSSLPYERMVIMFSLGLLPPTIERQVFPPNGGNRVFLLNEREQIWFEETCLGLEKSNLGEEAMRDSLSSMIHILFTKLSSVPEVTGRADPAQNDIVNQIVRFINTNLTAPLSLEIIEKNLYRDKAHLNRVFKNVMGCSIWEYVIQKRVHAARQVLFKTGSVSAAFAASGFHDYSVFYRNYVRCTKMNPTADLKTLTENLNGGSHMMLFDTADNLVFFQNELKENLLSFWMERCLDRENGGYLNCFTNDGSRLVSKDKYTWSQGRFLWIFSKLATMESPMFSREEREEFLALAKNGRDFLMSNVLIAPEDWRCVFLMEADGSPKYVEGCTQLDMSISADCFVVMGFAKYALAADDEESFLFAKQLNESVWERYQSGNYKSLPYPVSPAYQPHAKPMILTNVNCEMYRAAERFDPEYAKEVKEKIRRCHEEDFSVFMDPDYLIHEFRYTDGDFPPDLFGQHINPGHTLEDLWFQLEAAEILEDDTHLEAISRVAKKTMETGWDKEYGGILHFVTCDGKGMTGDVGAAKDEPQMKLVLDDWASKLWWVHSEALYTTLLLFDRTGDEVFLSDFEKVKEYTFRTFPNPDRKIREWIQIRTREGKPQEKVVALPVKDPYHIIRNMALIIELLEKRLKRTGD